MKIRNARISDVNEVSKLGNAVNEFEVVKDTVFIWPKNILLNIVKSKKDIFLVAEEDKKIVGFIIANYSKTFSKATIENLFVIPTFRNRKIGELLLASMIDKLKELKCGYICILANGGDKKLIQWYRKQGFTKGLDFTWLDKKLSKNFSK